tara:strand:+ start:21200 stop:21535 length:336 start_codon:yes stop_codon:yes gene_type:complete
MKKVRGYIMAIEMKKELAKHNDEAVKYLKAHFGGEYPPYFKNSLGEQCYRKELTQFLFKLERGEISPQEFDIELKKIYTHIDGLRPWDEAFFNTTPGNFPNYPDTDRTTLN